MKNINEIIADSIWDEAREEQLPVGEPIINEGYMYEKDCSLDCKTVDGFMHLTDELIKTIVDLEEEVVRWRQVLIKYLPPDWADGLQQDILNNLSRDFEGDPAYDLYVNWVCGGIDPQQEQSKLDRMRRLTKGTDETSIDYL
jgi:hypothetical protein